MELTGKRFWILWITIDSYCINPVMYNKENKLSCCFREYIYTCVFSNRGILICNRLFR